MRVYGELTNRIMESSKPIEPKIGMGATVCAYYDRYAYTVVDVSKDKKEIRVTRDKAIRTDDNGMSESQSYRYETDPLAPEEIFILRKNGFYVKKGEGFASGTRIVIGERDEYYNYSF